VVVVDGVLEDDRAVLWGRVLLLLEKRLWAARFDILRDLRLTAKHGCGVVRAIAGKATNASLDYTVGGVDSRLTSKHGVVTVLVIGRAIAWKATNASLNDPVGGVLAVLVLGSLRLEEQVARFIFLFLRDSRLTTKQGVVAILGGGRAIAWEATDASMDDTVVGLGLGDTLAVLVGRILLHREERR